MKQRLALKELKAIVLKTKRTGINQMITLIYKVRTYAAPDKYKNIGYKHFHVNPLKMDCVANACKRKISNLLGCPMTKTGQLDLFPDRY